MDSFVAKSVRSGSASTKKLEVSPEPTVQSKFSELELKMNFKFNNQTLLQMVLQLPTLNGSFEGLDTLSKITDKIINDHLSLDIDTEETCKVSLMSDDVRESLYDELNLNEYVQFENVTMADVSPDRPSMVLKLINSMEVDSGFDRTLVFVKDRLLPRTDRNCEES